MDSTRGHGVQQVDVVVVEDDPVDADITLRALRHILPKPTIQVIGDGEIALARLTSEADLIPKLVILDLKLPRVHGLEILASMRGRSPGCATPVMVLTSSEEPRDVSRATELGCNAYVTKPIHWEEYVGIVCRTAASLLPDSRCAA